MTMRIVKCPTCLEEIDHLVHDATIIKRMMTYYEGGEVYDVVVCEVEKEARKVCCPKCKSEVARNILEAEEFLKPHDCPLIIEGIINLLKSNDPPMNIVEWYIPRYDTSIIALVICDSTVNSDLIDKVNRIFNITIFTWDASSAYVWQYGDYQIYKESEWYPPINPRWDIRRTSAIHLYYKIDEVGVPVNWTKQMRERRARGNNQDTL